MQKSNIFLTFLPLLITLLAVAHFIRVLVKHKHLASSNSIHWNLLEWLLTLGKCAGISQAERDSYGSMQDIVAEWPPGTDISVMAPGAPLPWGSVWQLVADWNILEVIRKPDLWTVFGHVSEYMTWVWLGTLHFPQTCGCVAQSLAVLRQVRFPWQGGITHCAAPWLQIPPPVNWGSDLNCCFCQPFRQSTEKLGNCHPVMKPGNWMLDLALWNAISK